MCFGISGYMTLSWGAALAAPPRNGTSHTAPSQRACHAAQADPLALRRMFLKRLAPQFRKAAVLCINRHHKIV